MELKEYSYDFEDLEIDSGIIEKFMGYDPGKSPEPIPELIQTALSNARDYCDIRGGYLVKDDIDLNRDAKQLRVDDITFNIRKVVSHQLRKIDQVAIFVCTAGPGISDWSKKLMHDGDMMMGYVVDVLGSEIVENAMDKIQDIIEDEMKEVNLGITDRYSPGYCDWQVSEQHKLFTFFPDQFCGITLSESSLMHPIKSVSGVIGIGEGAKRTGYACLYCDMVNCIYRQKRHEKKPDRC
jgi:hypothetical protein